mgnify:FL=1
MNIPDPHTQNDAPVRQTFRGRLAAFGRAITRRLFRDEFSCSECDHWRSCGLTPDENCVRRLQQMADDPAGFKRRMKARAALLKYGIVG